MKEMQNANLQTSRHFNWKKLNISFKQLDIKSNVMLLLLMACTGPHVYNDYEYIICLCILISLDSTDM